MSKFNAGTVLTAVRGVIQSEQTASGRTFEAAPGFARDAKSELFLLAVTNFVGEKSFYEAAGERDARYAELVHQVAKTDAEWLTEFGRWLRSSANMRSASLVLAAEAVKSGVPGFRGLVSSVLQRADEPGEMIAYWHSTHGKNVPKAIKRGVADAAQRLYTERNVLKYDTASHSVRFADVIRLCHVEPKADWQTVLFQWLIGERIGVEQTLPEHLVMLRANRDLRALSPVEARSALTEGRWSQSPSDLLSAAGMNWENVPSLVDGAWTASLWEAMIPSMGYMALLRNLRNFDQAKVSDRVAKKVADRLSDADEVARSRQLPLRFLSAYRAAPSLRWSWPLEQALDTCLGNIPVLRGKTLILIDTSTSMNDTFSKDGTLKRWDAAVVFGLALARRCEDVDVVSFASEYYGRDKATMWFPPTVGESLLKSVDRWKAGGYFLGGGTDTPLALRKHYRDHTRVVVLTDEQAMQQRYQASVDASVPANVPMHTLNLAGYKQGHAPDKVNRYTYGGLTDAMFSQIAQIEAGVNGAWPWLAD